MIAMIHHSGQGPVDLAWSMNDPCALAKRWMCSVMSIVISQREVYHVVLLIDLFPGIVVLRRRFSWYTNVTFSASPDAVIPYNFIILCICMLFFQPFSESFYTSDAQTRIIVAVAVLCSVIYILLLLLFWLFRLLGTHGLVLVLPHTTVSVPFMLLGSIAVNFPTTDFLPTRTRTNEMPSSRLIYLAAYEHISRLIAQGTWFSVVNFRSLFSHFCNSLLVNCSIVRCRKLVEYAVWT